MSTGKNNRLHDENGFALVYVLGILALVLAVMAYLKTATDGSLLVASKRETQIKAENLVDGAQYIAIDALITAHEKGNSPDVGSQIYETTIDHNTVFICVEKEGVKISLLGSSLAVIEQALQQISFSPEEFHKIIDGLPPLLRRSQSHFPVNDLLVFLSGEALIDPLSRHKFWKMFTLYGGRALMEIVSALPPDTPGCMEKIMKNSRAEPWTAAKEQLSAAKIRHGDMPFSAPTEKDNIYSIYTVQKGAGSRSPIIRHSITEVTNGDNKKYIIYAWE